MNILFLGGDKRMSYAAAVISQYHEVFFYGEHFPENIHAIVLPMPLSKNGSDIFAPLAPEPIPLNAPARLAAPSALILAGGGCDTLASLCAERSLRLINYSSEALTLRNAALTAEAAVPLLAQSSDGSLLGSRVLITGYGRISRELARRLAAFGADCAVAARRTEAQAEAQLAGLRAFSTEEIPAHIAEFDYIANTVPAPLFTERDFAGMRPGCVFIELATLPNTPPPAPHVRYIHAPGLPGRYSPKKAGEYIAEELLRYLI